MPIEFNCRVCSAIIRVPDKAAGGKGKCPKCGIRLTVPKKSAAKPTPKAEPAEEEPFFAPEIAIGPVADSQPVIEDDPEDVVELETASFDPSDLTSPPADDFQFGKPNVPSPVRSSTRRMKQKKRNNQSVIIGGLVVLALIVIAGFFLYSILTAERVAGDFTAGTAATLELPSVLISKAKIKLSAEEVSTLLRKLELNPLPMTSSSMQIELIGAAEGLKVSIAAGAQSQFYRVSVKGNADVEKYLEKHRAELEEQRVKELDQSTTAFFIEYQKVLAKQSSSEGISPFHDTLAIPALVGGFGYSLAAVHGRVIYRCIYEDRDGGLYFLLPAEVTSFRVIGRDDAAGHPIVPVELNVKVAGEITPLKKPVDQSSKKSAKTAAPKAAKVDPEMDDEKMDGKN